MTGITPVLEARGLAVGYRHGRTSRTVSDSLDLTVKAGELVALLGPNGAGKTTLLRTLAGAQPPLAGTVHVNGDDLHRLTPREGARRVAVVLTERVEAGMLTAHELVALGRYPYTGWLGEIAAADAEIVEGSLAAAGAAALAERRIAELSDGERQRVLIARALAQATPLILLDEPTAFLDLPRRVELMRLLAELAHGAARRAILLTTHDLDLALRYADTLWLLGDDGRLHVGTPATVRLTGVLEAVFGETIQEIL